MMMRIMLKIVTQFFHCLLHLKREMGKTLTHLTAQSNQLDYSDDDDDDDDVELGGDFVSEKENKQSQLFSSVSK